MYWFKKIKFNNLGRYNHHIYRIRKLNYVHLTFIFLNRWFNFLKNNFNNQSFVSNWTTKKLNKNNRMNAKIKRIINQIKSSRSRSNKMNNKNNRQKINMTKALTSKKSYHSKSTFLLQRPSQLTTSHIKWTIYWVRFHQLSNCW